MEENTTYVYTENNNPVMSVVDWIIVLILTSIPIVNLIMLCIWAFGSKTPPTKANFAKAALILMVIAFILSLIFGGAIAGMLASTYGY